MKKKRKALTDFCYEKDSCEDCPLMGMTVCSCGRGHMFDIRIDNEGYMTNAEVIGAYEIVFGKTEKETYADSPILITNADKIKRIDFYFKED